MNFNTEFGKWLSTQPNTQEIDRRTFFRDFFDIVIENPPDNAHPTRVFENLTAYPAGERPLPQFKIRSPVEPDLSHHVYIPQVWSKREKDKNVELLEWLYREHGQFPTKTQTIVADIRDDNIGHIFEQEGIDTLIHLAFVF